MTRQQFENLLKSIYNSQVFTDSFEVFLAIYTNDKTLMDSFITNYLRAQGRINFYLTEWDNAPDQPAKDAVVGSVDGILGNASVNPDDARVWPGSGGLFGNVYEA
jgi:hypothetical protein